MKKQLRSLLIIDDNEADVFYVKCILKRMNLNTVIFTCSNGEEAIEFFDDYDAKSKEYGDDFPPPIVMLDINMPLMNGWEFLDEYVKRFGSDDRYSSAVFLMFSSSVNPDDRSKAKNYSCVRGYLNKPLSAKDFEKAIELSLS